MRAGYETTGSTVKTDFMRKWHHNRSGKPISLDEMMENEDGDIFEVTDPRGEFEQKVISEMQIAAFAEQEAANSHVYERAANERSGGERWKELRDNRDRTRLEH